MSEEDFRSEAWLNKWGQDKFTIHGQYKPRVFGQMFGNTDWALARALHSALVDAMLGPVGVANPVNMSSRAAVTRLQTEPCPACGGSGDGVDMGECAQVSCMCNGSGQIPGPIPKATLQPELMEILKRLVDRASDPKRQITSDTGAPYHSHVVPGKWDADGSDCQECADWDALRALVAGEGGDL